MPSTLYPVFEMPATVAQREQERAKARQTPAYRRDIAFDFELGDIVIDGTGRPVLRDGHASWAQWCVKTVLTQRGAHPVYGSRYGVDLARARQMRGRAAQEAALTRAITEALLADPRTKLVREFRYTWEGDQVLVTFVVVPAVGMPQQVDVRL